MDLSTICCSVCQRPMTYVEIATSIGIIAGTPPHHLACRRWTRNADGSYVPPVEGQ